MKKILNKKIGNSLILLGLVIMITSLFIRINELNNKNEELTRLVEVQGTQIIQCNEELNSIYGKYLELEEKNMVLEAIKKSYEKKSEIENDN